MLNLDINDEFLEANIHMENSKYIDAIKKYESILEKRVPK